ncbi:MAG: AsmA family protein, partial [bacterium]
MKTALKWILAALGSLLGLALAASLLLPVFIDGDDYKRWLGDAVEARTGRRLEIGALTISGGLAPRIQLEAIRYPNARWSERPFALEIEQATLSLDLWSLLRARLMVDDIVLRRPRLWIERNADGAHNLALPARRKPDASAAAAGWLELSRLRLLDGEITVNTRNRQWDLRIADARAVSVAPERPVEITVRGEIEQTALSATATAASVEALFARRQSPLSINARLGAANNRIRADGSARDLLTWRGLDLQLDFDLSSMPALSTLLATDLSKMPPVRGGARLHQPGRFGSMQLQAIDLRADHLGLRGSLRGEIARLTRLSGLDLTLAVAGAPELALPNWIARHGAFEARARAALRGALRDLRVEVERAEAENAALRLHAHGTLAYAERKWRGALPLSIELKSVDDLIARPALPATASADDANESPPSPATAPSNSPVSPPPALIGAAHASGELVRTQSAWRAENLKLSLAREALKFEARGAIDHIPAAPAGAFSIALEAADGRYLQPWLGDALPPLSDLRLNGSVAFGGDDGGDDGDRAAATIDALRARVDADDAKVDGDVGDDAVTATALRARVESFEVRAYDVDWSARGVVGELARGRG